MEDLFCFFVMQFWLFFLVYLSLCFFFYDWVVMMGLCLCGCLRLTDLGSDEEGAEIDRACSSCEGGGHFGLFSFACYGHGLMSGYVGCFDELGRE